MGKVKADGFTVWGENMDELEDAVRDVEGYMDKQTGSNAISYQIIGEDIPLPWDTGYITDEALKNLQQRYIIV